MALVAANVSDYLTLSTGALTPQIALSYWVKILAWPTGAHQTFGGYGFTGTTNGFGAETDNGPSAFLDYGNVFGGPEPPLTTANVASSYAGWQFFFHYVDPTGVLRIYYSDLATTPTPALLLTTSAANVGVTDAFSLLNAGQIGSVFAENCKMSAVKAWVSTSFSAGDVLAEFNNQAPQKAGALTYLSCNPGSVFGEADAGANWTANGTITDVSFDSDSPPFSPPAPPAASSSSRLNDGYILMPGSQLLA